MFDKFYLYNEKKNLGKTQLGGEKQRQSMDRRYVFTASFTFLSLIIKYFQSPETIELSQNNQVTGSKIRENRIRGCRLMKEDARNTKQINIWEH